MKTSYFTNVIDAATNDFPFVAQLPKRKQSKLVKLWQSFRHLSEIQEKHGFPVPRVAAAKLLEVHPTRIDQFIAAGRLQSFDWNGHVYVTENSLVDFAREERKNGRPCNGITQAASSPLGAFRLAKKNFAEK
jgi:hypothetical protein